jgi:hypothetical protein
MDQSEAIDLFINGAVDEQQYADFIIENAKRLGNRFIRNDFSLKRDMKEHFLKLEFIDSLYG